MLPNGAVGALVCGEGYTPSTEGTIVYLACEDLDVELGKVENAGGTVFFPKTAIGENGFIAHISDTEGNRVALHSMQ